MVDTRAASPGLWYGGSFPGGSARRAGDVAARLEVRALELIEVFSMLDELLSGPVRPGAASRRRSAALGVARVESPRGETVCAVEIEASLLSACTCAPAPTPTGRPWRSPPRETSCPTSP